MTSTKQIWEIHQEVNEGTSSVKVPRLDVLRSKLNYFKGINGESVNDIYSRLMTIINELQGLGASEVTDNLIVNKLLRLLDQKFDTMCTLIKKHADFKTLTPSQIHGRLPTHEMIMDDKKELYGSRCYWSHALKPKPDSSIEEFEESSDGSIDKDSIGKDLALLVKKFNRFQKVSCYKKYDSKK